MLKIACLITGDNYKSVAADTPASKKKIIAMSLAVMVPTLVWLFNGFMLSSQVLQTRVGWAILTAIVCGSIVFLVEKLIIMANGNGWLSLFRICIGLVVALLGSISLDEVIFKDDIDFSVAKIKQEAVVNAKTIENTTFSKLHNLANLDAEIQKAQIIFNHSDEIATAEADGSGGTGNRGIGNIAKLKYKKALDRKEELNKLLLKKQRFIDLKDSSVHISGVRASLAFNEHALLIRIRAMFQLIKDNGFMMFVYVLFTTLLFFFEFLVVILKLTWKKTNYEYKMEMIEEIGARRRAFLQKSDSPLLDPGNYISHYKTSKEHIKSDSIFN